MTRQPSSDREEKQQEQRGTIERQDDRVRDTDGLTEGADGQRYDAEGLLVDEYSDASLEAEPSLDALDVPAAMVDEAVLDDVADVGQGIEESDAAELGAEVQLLGDGGRRLGGDRDPEDEIDDAHSVEDLERATVGRATRLTDGTDDAQLHGEQLLDSPDKPTKTGRARKAR